MLDLIDIARMEEARQARALAQTAPASMSLAGGTLGRSTPGSWLNNGMGLGLSGPVEPDVAERIVGWFEPHGIEPRVELAPFVDRSLVRALASSGFVVRQFETVFFRELDPARPAAPARAAPEGLQIRAIDPSDEGQVLLYCRTAMRGFLPDERDPTPEELEQVRPAVVHPSVISACAWLDGQCVSAGGCEVSGEVTALFGLSTLSAYRRRGIQQAMLAWRMNEAARRGARLATIGSLPGAATERNVRRMGFSVAYTKTHVVRPGPGLVGLAYGD